MPRIHKTYYGTLSSRIDDVVITGVDDSIDLPPELVPIGVDAEVADGAAKSTASASWSWHASQWLKGEAAMLGAAAIGSLGYFASRSRSSSASAASLSGDSTGLTPREASEAGLTLAKDITT